MPKIVCVVPSIRPAMMESFRAAWKPLFEKHAVTLVTVWDGERPRVEIESRGLCAHTGGRTIDVAHLWGDLFCRHTDACRNAGFIVAAASDADYVLTLDDDVVPVTVLTTGSGWQGNASRYFDPIQAHLDALSLRVPISWMNTAHCGSEFLRGVPYGVRDEAPVMLSHGVWVGTPDFDGETQLRLEFCTQCNGTGVYTWPAEDGGSPPMRCGPCDGTGKKKVPHSLPYYVGPVPRGVLFGMCGMNLMVRAEALPYLYFAPMGPDSGVEGLNRFADIWCGVHLKRTFDERGWACYTGASTVLHTRASDARKNVEQEKLGREWNEAMWTAELDSEKDWSKHTGGFYHVPTAALNYFIAWKDKRSRYADLIRKLQGKT